MTLSNDDLFTQTVQLLTTAARRTRTIGAGTISAHTEPADFAEFLTEALAGTAANLGGIEALLAGRPGSWEADHLRQLLYYLAGDDEPELLRYRTEPVRVPVHVEYLLYEIGATDLYDEAYQELDRRIEATGYPSFGSGLIPTPEQEATVNEIEKLREALEQQQQQEWTAYGQAFGHQILAAADELYPGQSLPIEVVITLDGAPTDGGPSEPEPDFGPADRLWSAARLATPLPGSGIPLRDYPAGTSIATTERTAGRTPLARLSR